MSESIQIKAQMDINEIVKILPQRYPFLMLDKIIDFSSPNGEDVIEGRIIKALKNVTVNEPFFPGHFPHRPIMPGVMQIEAMAQTAAIACWSAKNQGQDILIAGINRARFRKPVVPGDTLIFESKVKRFRRRLAIIECKAYVDGQVVSEAEVLAALGN